MRNLEPIYWIAALLGSHVPAETPTAPQVPPHPTFVRHVLPVLNKLGCSSINCHGSFKGQNGLGLSVFGRDPRSDYASVTQGRDRTNVSDPEASLLVAKPTLAQPHGGDRQLNRGSWEYRLLGNWLADGAPFGPAEAPQKLEVVPHVCRLVAGRRPVQLRAFAEWADGSRDDVTWLASYQGTDDAIAVVGNNGQVRRGQQPGSAQVVVRYGSKVASATILAPRVSSAHRREPALPVQTPIDRFIGERLKELELDPSPNCSDAEFLRRASLDAAGTLPSRAELQSFLADGRTDKRGRKIEDLLGRESHAWRWANMLAALSGCDERELDYAAQEMWTTAPQLAYLWLDWLRVRIAADQPYDEIVAGILLATSREGRSYRQYAQQDGEIRARLATKFDDGGLYASRKTNDIFWRRYSVIYDRQRPAEAVAQAFMGVHLECARCHDHPTDRWTRADHHGFAATFQRVVYSELPLTRADKLAIWAGTSSAAAIGSLAILGLAVVLYRRGHRVSAALGYGLLAAVAAVALPVITSYFHVLSRQPNAPIRSLGFLVAAAWEKSDTLASSPALAVVASSIPVMGIAGVCLYLARRMWAKRPRLAAALVSLSAGLAAFGTGVIADGCFLMSQPAGQAREPLAHNLHHRLLRRLGYGGCGQYPREVFLADGNYGEMGTPRLLDGNVLGEVVGRDPREQLVDWLRRPENPYLAPNIVNRVWAQYFGRGLVDPPDDLSESNPATHPELLQWLTADFVKHGWSLKHLHRLIMNSAAYQRSWRPNETNAGDARHYARFYPRRLQAEQLIHAIDTVTGTTSDFGPGNAPAGASPFQVAALYPQAATCGARALRTFGRGTSGAQEMRVEGAMFTLVDPGVRSKISHPAGRLARLLAAGKAPSEVLDELYLAAFARLPLDQERSRIAAHLAEASDAQEAWQEVVWALINSQEFQFNF